jgi:paraquat-inducible protein B
VPLGSVSDIQLRYGRSQIVVVAAIDPSRVQGLHPQSRPGEVAGAVRAAVGEGLRAQLQLQSLVTGQLYVGLDFHAGTPATLTGTDPDQCEIPTIPTTLAQMQEKMEKVVTQLEQLPLKQALEAAARAADAIQKVAASPEIPRILRAADGTMQEAQGLVRGLNAQLDPVVGDLRMTLDQARRTIEAVGGDLQHLVQHVDTRVGPLAESVAAAADSTQALMRDGQRTLARLDDEIAPTASALRQAAEAARGALQRAETTLDQASGLLSGESPMGYQVAEALDELTRTARTLRGLGEELERQPNMLLFGRGGSNR